MSIEIRPIVPEEFDAFAVADAAAFGFEPNPIHLNEVREIFEFDRTLASFDGGEIVGTTSIYSYELTVPGGVLPMAGVTWVSVKPTHRRQGVLTGLMRRQLRDVRERGEPVAALWASESVIYGRFGYGLAAEGAELRIQRVHASLDRSPSACGRTRLIDREEALRCWPAVYDEVRREQPGMFSRSERWWRHQTLRPFDEPRGGFSGRFYVTYEEDGRPLGYARYRIKGGTQDGTPDGTLAVQELMAASDSAYGALWRYLFGIDLISSIEARWRPIEEPLVWMLADPRRLVRHPLDSLWVRIVDVPAALEGRRYSSDGGLTFEVRDRFCDWTEGRYQLEVSDGRAACRPSRDEPDIELEIADLGAILLGGVRLTTLQRAGRVRGGWDTLRRADAMFVWEPLPWCPEVF